MNLEEIAEDYLSRLRSKTAPTTEEYAKRFPELADEIRDTLPALAAMEQLGLGDGGHGLYQVRPQDARSPTGG